MSSEGGKAVLTPKHTLVAAAAAKIKAQLDARKGIQHVDVPPIRSDSTAAAAGPPGGTINGDMYIADGDYIKDIEVNDLRNRYTLTKGSTQKMVITLPGLFLLIYKQTNNQSTASCPSSLFISFPVHGEIKSDLHWLLE